LKELISKCLKKKLSYSKKEREREWLEKKNGVMNDDEEGSRDI